MFCILLFRQLKNAIESKYIYFININDAIDLEKSIIGYAHININRGGWWTGIKALIIRLVITIFFCIIHCILTTLETGFNAVCLGYSLRMHNAFVVYAFMGWFQSIPKNMYEPASIVYKSSRELLLFKNVLICWNYLWAIFTVVFIALKSPFKAMLIRSQNTKKKEKNNALSGQYYIKLVWRLFNALGGASGLHASALKIIMTAGGSRLQFGIWRAMLNAQSNTTLCFHSWIKSMPYSILISLYSFIKKCVVPITISIAFIVFSFIFFKLSFLRIVSGWLAVLLLFFWLLSGFNHLLKRYRFGKFTSAIQRFWKRAFMCFWLIEGFLFTIFFYYLLNASQEPTFMYDQPIYFTNHLVSASSFISNCSFVGVIILLYIFILVNLKVASTNQNVAVIVIITLCLCYILFVESYQFYYVVNYYDDSFWIFSEEEHVWELEHDTPRTRNSNHYMTLLILAKFWHYIFIFGSWVFFVMKLYESGRIRYAMLSMGLQNILIFYIMNWLCAYTWLKWFSHRFIDQTYYWFFTSFRQNITSIWLQDTYQLVVGALDSIAHWQLPTYKGYAFYFFSPSQLLYSYNSKALNLFVNCL